MSTTLNPDLYRQILETLPAGLYVVDSQRRILLWNEGAEKITGYLRQEVIGRICERDLLAHCDESSEELCGSACPLLGTMHDGKPRDTMALLRHKAGPRIPVRVRAVPLREDGGTIVGAIEMFDELHSPAPQCPQLCGMAPITAAMDAFFAGCATTGEAGTLPVLIVQVLELDSIVASHGKNAAYSIMEAISQTLCYNLHAGDRLGRCTNGCFVAMLPGCSPAVAVRVAERLRKVVGSTAIPWWGDRLAAQVSVEVMAAQPGDTAASVLARATSQPH
jgi:PAS domain S-box-containing protein